jgi:hypothetical protein
MDSKNLKITEIVFDLGLIDEDGGMLTKMDHKQLEALPIKGDIKMVLTQLENPRSQPFNFQYFSILKIKVGSPLLFYL